MKHNRFQIKKVLAGALSFVMFATAIPGMGAVNAFAAGTDEGSESKPSFFSSLFSNEDNILVSAGDGAFSDAEGNAYHDFTTKGIVYTEATGLKEDTFSLTEEEYYINVTGNLNGLITIGDAYYTGKVQETFKVSGDVEISYTPFDE